MSGGHLLAAGLDGGNTIMLSSPASPEISIVLSIYKIKGHPIGCPFLFLYAGLERTARLLAGKKVSGGHFFSPWESPFIFGRSP